ncbi:hypothetical protein GOB57_21790 [Sinorhizobium meliloti]|nr:hypothetical protein [Sinorhizobium meliloti]
MTTPTYNRNGHLSRFEDFAPRRRTLNQLMEEAIAAKKGDRPPEPEPEVIRSFSTVDLVRYRLNSRRLADDYVTMGDPHTNPYDEAEYSGWMARFGVMDRESREPLAMLWILNDPNWDRGFQIASASFSKTKAADATEILAVLQELDVPPGHNSSVDGIIAGKFDLWHEDGNWIAKEPRHLLVFKFESTCFAVSPPITDSVDVYVPLDPSIPLDGGGDETAAYEAKERYRSLAHSIFWEMGVHKGTRPGFSSWGGYGEPTIVKAIGPALYNECDRAEAKPRPKGSSPRRP